MIFRNRAKVLSVGDMTADVLAINRADRTPEEENVRKSIRALMAWSDMNVEELADRTGIPRTTMYKRLSTKPGPSKYFLLREVVDIARLFGVDVQDMVNGTVQLPARPAPTSATNQYEKALAAVS